MGGNQVALSQESEGKAVEAEPTSKLNPSIDVSPLQGLPVQLFPIPLLSFPRELFGPRRLLGSALALDHFIALDNKAGVKARDGQCHFKNGQGHF